MPDPRKIIFAENEIYHIFNRGLDKRPTYTNKKEYSHALETIQYYQFANIIQRFSMHRRLPKIEKNKILQNLYSENERRVEILTYAIMPNHFHFLLKQLQPKGITKFMADITNSHTKYFNGIHERNGPLFQGLFKAVHIESDEQLLHVVRYIHLNPVSSFLIEISNLEKYPYTSYTEYLEEQPFSIASPSLVLSMYKSKETFRQFTEDQAGYARKLEQIKHLVFE